MNVKLYQGRITNRLEAMDLAGLDDKDISRLALERLAVYRPDPLALPNKLDLVIGMAVWTGPEPGFP